MLPRDPPPPDAPLEAPAEVSCGDAPLTDASDATASLAVPAADAALLLAAPGRDEHLADEVRRALPDCSLDALAPGVLRVAGAGESTGAGASAGCSLAFATQVLPEVKALTAGSVARWAELCTTLVVDALAAHAGPWRLHLLAAPVPGSKLGAGRAQLVRKEIVARLKERRRALHRTLVADDAMPWRHTVEPSRHTSAPSRDTSAPSRDAGMGVALSAPAPDALVQVLLTDLEQGWISIATPPVRHAWRHVLSRFPAGLVDVPEDRGPPSRAYRKLLEAELHLGQRIEAGQQVVDLGASPGGWSAVALARGANVLAVDRAPLRDDLMANPLLRFVQRDAFKHAPDPAAPVDWLLCDVIAFPERTLDLLSRWLSSRACRRFIVTLKFRGTEDYARLEECKALLAAHGGDYLLRQLGANGNEVTACGA